MLGGSGLVSVSATGVAGGALEQPDRLPTMPSVTAASRAIRALRGVTRIVVWRRWGMALLLLEALLALVILIAIVWWTMFSGRHKGELKNREAHKPEDKGPP